MNDRNVSITGGLGGLYGVLYALGKPLLSRGTALEDELVVCFLSETWFSYIN